MTVINMPLDYNEAEYIELAKEGTEDSGYFWKQLIPMNYNLNYKGRQLKFDESYLRNIKKAFEEDALGEQTAFQLANDGNEHDTEDDKRAGRNYDPERYRGAVQNLAINSRGLFGKFKLTGDGAKTINENKKLGVSVSLRENFESDNGKKYPVVMRHVLGTLDPKIRRMGAWQKELISLTADKDEEVIDLTTPTDTAEKVEIDKSELETLRSELKEFKDAEEVIDSWANEADDDEDSEEEEETTSLSNVTDPRIIELSNKVAASEWRAERAELVRAGVPNKMLDLAATVMADGASTYDISLSNDETVDSKDLIRKILNEAKGTIDLSGENGHSLSQDERNEEKKAYDGFESSFMNDLF